MYATERGPSPRLVHCKGTKFARRFATYCYLLLLIATYCYLIILPRTNTDLLGHYLAQKSGHQFARHDAPPLGLRSAGFVIRQHWV